MSSANMTCSSVQPAIGGELLTAHAYSSQTPNPCSYHSSLGRHSAALRLKADWCGLRRRSSGPWASCPLAISSRGIRGLAGSSLPSRRPGIYCQAANDGERNRGKSRSGRDSPVIELDAKDLSPVSLEAVAAATALGETIIIRRKKPRLPAIINTLPPRPGSPYPARPASPLRASEPDNDQWTTLRALVDPENPVHPIFDFARWDRHRSPRRHWRHMFTVYDSVVFRLTLFPVMALTGITAIAIAIDRELFPMPKLPAFPFLVTATLLGLLLVFRTNASYDRWWEARKAWGMILQRTRDFTRQCVYWIQDEAMSNTLARLTMAWARAVKCSLRKGENLRTELEEILTENEMAMVMKASNKPNVILSMMTDLVSRSGVSEVRLTEMDINLTALGDLQGTCERILRTPLPVSYTRHTSRFILIYLIFLPLAIYPDLGVGTVMATFFTSYSLLGIETIGTLVEEPFHILPLDLLCFIITCELLEIVTSRRIQIEKERHVAVH